MTQQIGFFREITPCPRSGKITFQQIGAIRQITSNIACDNEELLLARKPNPTGELDGLNNPIYALKEPTNDPSDYYSAYWGCSYDVIKGESLGPTPLGDWNEQFLDPQPPDVYDASGWGSDAAARDGLREVTSKVDLEGNPYIKVSSRSGGIYRYAGSYPNGTVRYEWFWYPRTAYAISYLSRVNAGDKLVFYFEWLSNNTQWYNEDCYMRIIGWRDGWMSNDEKEYAKKTTGKTGWQSELIEIEVDESYRDIAIAFYQIGSDTEYEESCFFRNVHCWRA